MLANVALLIILQGILRTCGEQFFMMNNRVNDIYECVEATVDYIVACGLHNMKFVK